MDYSRTVLLGLVAVLLSCAACGESEPKIPHLVYVLGTEAWKLNMRAELRSQLVEETIRQGAEFNKMKPSDLSQSQREQFTAQVKVLDLTPADSPGLLKITFRTQELGGMVIAAHFAASMGPFGTFGSIYGFPERLAGSIWMYRPKADVLHAKLLEGRQATAKAVKSRLSSKGVSSKVTLEERDSLVVHLTKSSPEQLLAIRKTLTGQGRLTFRIVDKDNTWLAGQEGKLMEFRRNSPQLALTAELVPTRGQHHDSRNGYIAPYVRASKKDELVAFGKTLALPEGRMMGFEKVETGGGGEPKEVYWRTQLLWIPSWLTSEHLAQASVEHDEEDRPYVSLDFTAEGGRLFGDLTERNVNEYLAIMVDERVYSTPIIMERIGGGRVRISSGAVDKERRLKEAKGLVDLFSEGVYPLPLVFEDCRVEDCGLMQQLRERKLRRKQLRKFHRPHKTGRLR